MKLGLALSPCASSSALTPAPVLTSLSFDLADTAGGDSITITGTFLTGATACTVGGTSATITANTATTLTFTMPAKASGTYNVVVTTAGGASNALTIEAFNPTDLTLTGDWAPSFSGSPWIPAVGGVNERLVEGVNPPAVGTAVNGYTPAAFDGVNDKLTSTSGCSVYFSVSAYTVVALIYVDSFTVADPGAAAPYDCASICGGGFSGSGASCGGVAGSGASGVWRYGHHATGVWGSAAVAISTGAWVMVSAKYDGTTVSVAKNAGTAATTTLGVATTQSASFGIGPSFSSKFPNVRVLHAFVTNTSVSDANLVKVRKYFNTRYLMSLA